MKKKVIIVSSLVAVILVILIGFKACRKEAKQISFETAKVKIGTVSNTITATGTVQATRTVSVGTQVSGIVDKIYVDYNSHVKAGDLLAELDKRTLTTSLENAQANLENAKAEMTYQTANYNRIKALTDKKLVAQNDYDQAIYNFTKAEAGLKTSQLEYNRARINLNYATIHSPIDGVVLERAVDEGQTVAASFSTPTLFSIANDLTQMQVEASIDEADIGKIKVNQRVSFTVDAFTDMKFEGKVVQIRLQPVTKSNVVTYTVIVKAPNPDFKLMPGMTASIIVYVEEAVDVLIVSSRALHFTPEQSMLESYMKSLPSDGKPAMDMPEGSKLQPNFESGPKGQGAAGQMIWVKNGVNIHPVPVKIGIDDDLNAQVIEGLKEGEEVVLAMTASAVGADPGADQSRSPFMPKMPSRNKKAAGAAPSRP
jgi:HlyD family secretion protein